MRQAQQIAGELLWLSGLTRPDLQHGVGAISRMIAVSAEEAFAMGEQVIKYLRRFPARGLWYGHSEMAWGEEGDLSQPMGHNSFVGFSDASFAPQAGRSLQTTLAYYSAGLVAWSSTKQGLTTLSTAESELVGITSLFTDLRALEPLVQEIHGAPLQLQMHSDSQAAIAICSTPSNNWRTRHLRLRAAYVRKALESGRYSLHHVNGISMKADIGTKPLPAPRFQQLVAALGMSELSATGRKKEKIIDGSLEANVRVLLACLVVASLLDNVEAHRDGNQMVQALGNPDWQFFIFVVVVSVCCWEAFKAGCRNFGIGCKSLVSWCSRIRLEHESLGPEVRVVHHVDDVAVTGPRETVQRYLDQQEEAMEVMTAFEGPGTPLLEQPRRRRRGQVFEFNSVEIQGWPPCLTLDLNPVGQDRYEYRRGCRTLLRWHVSPRIRLFTPDQTRLPVALSQLTGRRRTYVIDISPDSPEDRRRKVHVDNWRVADGSRAYLGYSWIGCTALEIDF